MYRDNHGIQWTHFHPDHQILIVILTDKNVKYLYNVNLHVVQSFSLKNPAPKMDYIYIYKVEKIFITNTVLCIINYGAESPLPSRDLHHHQSFYLAVSGGYYDFFPPSVLQWLCQQNTVKDTNLEISKHRADINLCLQH